MRFPAFLNLKQNIAGWYWQLSGRWLDKLKARLFPKLLQAGIYYPCELRRLWRKRILIRDHGPAAQEKGFQLTSYLGLNALDSIKGGAVVGCLMGYKDCDLHIIFPHRAFY